MTPSNFLMEFHTLDALPFSPWLLHLADPLSLYLFQLTGTWLLKVSDGWPAAASREVWVVSVGFGEGVWQFL